MGGLPRNPGFEARTNDLIRKYLLPNIRAMSAATAHRHERRGPGRPREFDLDRALDRAIDVFSAHGYHATSLSSLAASMEIAEGSLYKAFKDKRTVFIAAFERYVMQRNERLAQELGSAQTGRERVNAVLASYAEASHGATGRHGCLVVGSTVGLASSDGEMAKRVAATLAANEKRLLAFIRQGQADRSISPAIDPSTTARLLLSIVQGMRVLGKTGRSRAEMSSLVDRAMTLLD